MKIKISLWDWKKTREYTHSKQTFLAQSLFLILYNEFFLFNPIHLILGTFRSTGNVLA